MNNTLDQPVIDDDFQLLQKIENGISLTEVESSEIFASGIFQLIGITSGIISFYKGAGKINFSLSDSEKIAKFQQLLQWGKEVFISKTAFTLWLNQPSYGLANRVPAELLKTVTGMNLIINELKNIAYGNLA